MNHLTRLFRQTLGVAASLFAMTALAAAPSVNGTIALANATIIDPHGDTWSLRAGVIEENGVRVGSNYNVDLLLELDGVFYHRNTSNEWYAWNGSWWVRIADPRVPSANGTRIGVGGGALVAANGDVWTIATNEVAYRNGVRAGNNYNTILLLDNDGMISSENSTGHWYSWNGSEWIRAAADPHGPSLVQHVVYNSPVCPSNDPSCTPPFVGDSSVTFAAPTTKGNALWVAATVSDYGGIHSITVTDSQNNTFHELNQENDGAPGSQSVAQFYAGNIAGGTDTITVTWSSDNYKGVVAAEIAGVGASPLVGSSADIQDGNLSPVADNVRGNAIPMNPSGTPSLLVALTMDTDGGGSDTGGTGYCAVGPGTGFVQVIQLWNWSPGGQPACNLATLETKVVTGTGSVAGSFDSTHPGDPYVTVATVFH